MAPFRHRLVERHRSHAGGNQGEQKDQHQLGPHLESEREHARHDQPGRTRNRTHRDRTEHRVKQRAGRKPDQDCAAAQVGAAPQRQRDDHRHSERAGDQIDHGESGAGRHADPVGQCDIGDLQHQQHHGHASDDRRAQEAREKADRAVAADRHRQRAPDQRCYEERAVGGGKPARFDMADRQQPGEASGIGALDDRKAQQQHRLQDGGDPAHDEGDAVEVSDLFGGQIEGTAEQSRKHEHAGHPEHVLQPEQQQLRRRQRLVDADDEWFVRCRRRRNGLTGHESVPPAPRPLSMKCVCLSVTAASTRGRKIHQEVEEHAHCNVGIGGGDRLQRRVADAAVAASHEQHADVGHAAESHGVVAGAARQIARLNPGALQRRGQLRLQRRRAGRRRAALDLLHVDGDLAPPRDRIDLREYVGRRRVARGIVSGANIERQLATPRDHVDGAARHRQPPYRADQRRRGGTTALHVEHDLRRRRRGVTAQPHRHRAGMSGLPGDGHAVADGAGDRGDDAERQPLLQQHRPLLDVDLEIAGQILRPARQRRDRFRIEAGLVNGIRHALAGGIAPLQHPHVEAPGNGAAADIVRGEAHALLLGKADHVDMKREPAPCPVELFHRHQAGQNAEPTVIVARVEHGVVVRAQDQRLGRGVGGGIAADHVADPIDLGAHPGCAHQVAQLSRDRAMRGRQICAGQPVRRFGPLRQPCGQRDDALPQVVLPKVILASGHCRTAHF